MLWNANAIRDLIVHQYNYLMQDLANPWYDEVRISFSKSYTIPQNPEDEYPHRAKEVTHR